jgi:hypothetical protein
VSISRKWKVTWLAANALLIGFFLLLFFASDVSRGRLISLLIIGLFSSIFVYVSEVKPKSTERIIYIGLDTFCFGCLLLLLALKIILSNETFFAMFPPDSASSGIMQILILVVCWFVGGVIGEFIGKKMQYKWPPRTFQF